MEKETEREKERRGEKERKRGGKREREIDTPPPLKQGLCAVINAVLYLALQDKVMGLDNPDLINRTVAR